MNKLMHYQVIDDFFDTYNLDYARYLLRQTIKTADAEKIWKGPCPANVIYFTERVQLLAEAAFSIMEKFDFRDEIILEDTGNNALWMLTRYDTFCGWHRASTPWDYFPRHLSTTEFKDPYKALRKFTRYRPLNQWSEILQELCHHALSPISIHEFDDGTSMIGTWLHLHKLLEATHLIEVRTIGDEKQPRKKWKQGWQAEKKDVDTKESTSPAEDEKDEPSLEDLSREHIKEFFLFFGEDGAREELWAMLKRSLSNEGDQTPASDRSNMIFLYEQLIELVDDIHVLHCRQQAKQNTWA